MKNKKTFLYVFLSIFFIFLSFLLFNQFKGSPISKKALRIEIIGPDEVSLSNELEYILKYKNTSNFRLENLKLLLDCPVDSLSCDVFKKENVTDINKTRKEILLGDILPGQEKNLHFKVGFLGKEGESKEIKAEVEFKPENLNSYFVVDTTKLVLIKNVPLTLEFDMPLKIEEGAYLNFSLNYFSHFDFDLKDVQIEIDYPSNFEFKTSRPSPDFSDNQWNIKNISSLEGKKIEIQGKLLKPDNQFQKAVFKASFKIWSGQEYITIKSTEKEIEIIKPLIYLSQNINGSDNYVFLPGDKLDFDIYFKNIGDTTLNNQTLILQFDKDVFDFSTFKSKVAKAMPSENTIIVDWSNFPAFKNLKPNDQGKISFSINLKKNFQTDNGFVNETIQLSSIKTTFQIKLKSKIDISQKVFYSDDFFGNSGPLPPQVQSITTYTVVWQVKNCCNLVKDIKVKAKLPENVNLTGKIFPEEEFSNFSFDSDSKEIFWHIDELSPESSKTLAFQIAFSPSYSERGSIATLINGVELTAKDLFLNEEIKSSTNGVDTTLPDDDTVTKDMGIIR